MDGVGNKQYISILSDFCIGKSPGLHADPEDCRAYYDCSHGKTRHRTGLSTGLMFDPQKRHFVHSWEMDCPVKKGIALTDI